MLTNKIGCILGFNMDQIHGPDTAVLSVVFCLFWVLTLDQALGSAAYYILRSFVVIGYTLVMLKYQGNSDTFAEHLGWFLAVCHWLGIFQVLLYGDPRFTGRN